MTGRHAVDDAEQPGGPGHDPHVGIQVLHGSPSPEELAAVVAVLQAAADEADRRGRARLDEAPRSAWDASARGLRQPLVRGTGAWTRSLR